MHYLGQPLFIFGFPSPLDIDPFEFGVKLYDWEQVAVDTQNFEHSERPFEHSDFSFDLSDDIEETIESCAEVDVHCLSALSEHKKLIDLSQNNQRELFNRYSNLLKLPAYQEVVPFTPITRLPAYSLAFKGQRLYLMHAWKYAGEDKVSLVRGMLEQDIKFWRMALANSDILITKMIATAGIERHFKSANLILREISPNSVMAAVPPSWMIPIQPTERSFKRTIVGEWLFFEEMTKWLETENVPLFHYDHEDPTWSRILWKFIKPLWQPQASSNRQLEYLITASDLFDRDYKEQTNAIAKEKQLYDKHTDMNLTTYNFVGDLVFKRRIPTFSEYIVRVTDLEGLRRAALVVANLRSNNIVKNQVETQLSRHTLRNPYSDDSFLWDAETGSVVFRGLREGDIGKHFLLY